MGNLCVVTEDYPISKSKSQVQFTFIVDTREQSPLVFPMKDVKIERVALETGDYAVRIGAEIAPVRVERKSINDLFSSFSGDNYRREKEKIQRAKEGNVRYVLAIEGSCSDVRRGASYFRGGHMHQVQKDGLSQVRQIETISMRYGVEVRYCSGRDDMAFMVQEILMAYVRDRA